MFNNPVYFSDASGAEGDPPLTSCAECEKSNPNPKIGDSFTTSEGHQYQYYNEDDEHGTTWRLIGDGGTVTVTSQVNRNLPPFLSEERAYLDQYIRDRYPDAETQARVRNELTKMDIFWILNERSRQATETLWYYNLTDSRPAPTMREDDTPWFRRIGQEFRDYLDKGSTASTIRFIGGAVYGFVGIPSRVVMGREWGGAPVSTADRVLASVEWAVIVGGTIASLFQEALAATKVPASRISIPVPRVVSKFQSSDNGISASFTYADDSIIEFLANKSVNGSVVEFTDAAFYARGAVGNELKNTFGTRNMVEALNALKDYARSQGFTKMRLHFQRSTSSSSANPGKVFDQIFDL